MVKKLSIAIAQLNPIVGDIEGNLAKARAALPKRMLTLLFSPPILSVAILCMI